MCICGITGAKCLIELGNGLSEIDLRPGQTGECQGPRTKLMNCVRLFWSDFCTQNVLCVYAFVYGLKVMIRDVICVWMTSQV